MGALGFLKDYVFNRQARNYGKCLRAICLAMSQHRHGINARTLSIDVVRRLLCVWVSEDDHCNVP